MTIHAAARHYSKEGKAMAENSWNSGYRSSGWEAPAVGPVTEHATIGASITIKGEVSGQEALFIDGTVEGSIHFPDHRVTVGRHSKVAADIRAHDVVVMGSVKGNIHCSDLMDVRAESNIQGEIVTRRIRIDDGAILKGSVEIQAPAKNSKQPEVVKPEPVKPEPAKPEAAKAEAVPTAPLPAPAPESEPEKAESSKSLAAAAAATASASVAKRVAGSSVLWKPGR